MRLARQVTRDALRDGRVVGRHDVSVRLHPEVAATVAVDVVAS